MNQLNPATLQELRAIAFFKPEEIANGKPIDPDQAVLVEGLVNNFGLHKERVHSLRGNLVEMIGQLNPNFLDTQEGGGGGWTFLNLPFDKNGQHWGEHPDCELFTVLCMVNGLAKYLMPREMWDVLPGGVPYIVFSKRGF